MEQIDGGRLRGAQLSGAPRLWNGACRPCGDCIRGGYQGADCRGRIFRGEGPSTITGGVGLCLQK